VVVPPVVTGVVGADGLHGLGHFRVRQIDLAVPGLPGDLDGLSIAHASDLHIGRFLPPGVMGRVADAINAMRADLVAFTGDLNDASQETADEGVEFVNRLDRRGGLAMIEGNHDVQRSVEFFEHRMLAEGCPLLLDDGVTFRVPGRATPVQMLGITWGRVISGVEARQVGRARLLNYREFTPETMVDSVKAVAAKREAGAFPILLAHHPHAFDAAAEAGLPLVLSGHTHGGQIMLTKNIGAGPLRFKYWSGEYDKPGSKLLVSNGVGNWFPLRVNAPGEVVKVTLRRAAV
jgi:predicted MPP superfamily phosphohydrolase